MEQVTLVRSTYDFLIKRSHLLQGILDGEAKPTQFICIEAVGDTSVEYLFDNEVIKKLTLRNKVQAQKLDTAKDNHNRLVDVLTKSKKELAKVKQYYYSPLSYTLGVLFGAILGGVLGYFLP